MENYTVEGISKVLEECYPHDLKECLTDLYALANGAKEQGLDVSDLAETMKHRIERLPFPPSISGSGKSMEYRLSVAVSELKHIEQVLTSEIGAQPVDVSLRIARWLDRIHKVVLKAEGMA